MNVWYHQSTIFKRRHALLTAGLIALCVALITTLIFANVSTAAPGVNQTISFQGRLSKPTGGIVADGYYNIQFKIYQDGPGTAAGNSGGTLEWTENYINNGGTSGVQVKNGYFNVTLGSNNPFGSSVDWNQDTLWLSMNVAGAAAACTTFGSSPCTADGEMLPMKRMTSTPFALNSGMLGGKTADGFIQNTTTAQTADFNISGTGKATTLQGNTSVIAPLFDRADAGTLTIGSTNATTVNIGSASSNQTITIGTGAAAIDLTLGSVTGQSKTLIQGGNEGVRIHTVGGFAIQSTGTGIDNFEITPSGGIITRLGTDEGFAIRNSSNTGLFYVSSSLGRVGTNYGTNFLVQGTAAFEQGISITGTGSLTYQTPGGYNMSTAINIPNYTVGAYGSVLALGLPSTSAATARGILVSDGRTVAHQATIGILSHDENNVFGLSYNGTNTGTLSNTGNSVALQGNGLNLLTATNNGGAANVGIGNNASAGYALDVTGDINTSTQLRIGGVGTLTNTSLTFSAASTANIVSASGQSLNLDGKAGTTIQTNGTTRATFDTSNTLFLGNGTSAATPANFTIQATNSSTTAVAGASLTIQGGGATTGNANGGNLILDAGAKFGSGTGGALTIGATNASSITMGNASINITSTVLGTAIFKPTSGNDSTTAFQIQRANGTAMFVADSTNQTITFGDPASGNRTVISTSTGAITKYGTARNTKKITLAAEYTNSVLDAGTGSNNTGTMTSSIDLTNRMNYYKWTTSQATNQSYDVVVQVPLPTDFDGWASSTPLSITTRTSSTANGTITLEARDSAGAVQCDFVSVTPGSTSTWATNTSACALDTGTYTAGDYMTLRIRMQSPTSGDVRVGNINLSYLSKY